MPPAVLALIAGLGLGLSLIVAIGAQNIFVLRQGIKVEHVGTVVGICSLSDLALITAGVAGAGVVVLRFPQVLTVAEYCAAAFLLGYGLVAARRVFRPAGMVDSESTDSTSLAQTVLTCVGFTWLNPHVYLDTVVLLGSVAQSQHDSRWWFALGAGIGDTLWFITLGYSARWLRPVFTRPRAWRILDGLIAAVMATLAIVLVAQA